VRIVDITHAVTPQDVKEAAFIINEYHSYFEAGTVHVAVVDPTVGSGRRPMLVAKDGHYFVGPDNGIFSRVLSQDAEAYQIKNRDLMLKDISSTFHGRDIFAPAAAHLASGVQPPLFGPVVENPIRLDNIFPAIVDGVLSGEVTRLDRFGNAITNVASEVFKDFVRSSNFRMCVKDAVFTSLNRSYYEQDFTCLEGSSGYIEFAYFKGSFSAATGVNKGDPVRVELL
jgi:S-adenosyl-L-methionine hydrolase (adenosine-forming)